MSPHRRLPSRLGKYQVVRFLGEGGMGIVYEGFDPQIRRQVALKAIKGGAVSDEQGILDRFQREAEAAGRLLHPRIVTVYEYSEDVTVGEDGREARTPFIAMELVHGRELKRVLEEKAGQGQRLPLEQVHRMMSGLLEALAFSHRHNVVHRDIKPANIMVLPDGNIKVTDFSIARLLELTEAGTLTQHGTVLGTLSYMAPEQLRSDPVDGLTDVYAAGVVLYELLTGALPFSGTTEGLIYKVLNVQPEAPSKLCGDLPRAYDAVIERALAKAPRERFQSATEFQGALACIEAELAEADTALRSSPAGGREPLTAPAALPPEVLGLIHDAQPEKRLVAVLRLQALLKSGSAPIVVSTWQALERLQNDVSPAVAGAATRVLQDAGGTRGASARPATSAKAATDDRSPSQVKPLPEAITTVITTGRGSVGTRRGIILVRGIILGVVGALGVIGATWVLQHPHTFASKGSSLPTSGADQSASARRQPVASVAGAATASHLPQSSQEQPSAAAILTADNAAPSSASPQDHAQMPEETTPAQTPPALSGSHSSDKPPSAVTAGGPARLAHGQPPAEKAKHAPAGEHPIEHPMGTPSSAAAPNHPLPTQGQAHPNQRLTGEPLQAPPPSGSEQSSSTPSVAAIQPTGNPSAPAPIQAKDTDGQTVEHVSPPVPAGPAASPPAASVIQPSKPVQIVFQEPDMVHIPGGSFMMGSPPAEAGRVHDEGPQHLVQIAEFWLGKYDVSFDEWDVCVAEQGCRVLLSSPDAGALTRPFVRGPSLAPEVRPNDATPRPSDSGWGRGKQPAINVSWENAQQYARWLSRKTGKRYRLPTEAEWEYAARAGTTTAYYWGNTIGSGNANCTGCGSRWGAATSPVGSFAQNPWGLFDMSGNVSQWMQDCYHFGYDGAPKDGSALERVPCLSYIVRGGNWHSDPRSIRSASRAGALLPHNTIGFRVARSD